jgi:hypothetical protein
MTLDEQNFKRFVDLFGEEILRIHEGTCRHYTAGDGFMPLSVEVLYRPEPGVLRFAMAHRWKHPSGDLIADPDMELVVDTNTKTLSPRSFQMDLPPVYQTAESEELSEMQRNNIAHKLASFLATWLANIKSQGYKDLGTA